MTDLTSIIRVTLRHPLDEVVENDLTAAVLEMEMWYNANHPHRIWLFEVEPVCSCPPNQLYSSNNCPLHGEHNR